MAREHMGNWKEQVYYNFDQPMTKSILFEVIGPFYKNGYTVVAITSDMGATNRSLWKNLAIDH